MKRTIRVPFARVSVIFIVYHLPSPSLLGDKLIEIAVQLQGNAWSERDIAVIRMDRGQHIPISSNLLFRTIAKMRPLYGCFIMASCCRRAIFSRARSDLVLNIKRRGENKVTSPFIIDAGLDRLVAKSQQLQCVLNFYEAHPNRIDVKKIGWMDGLLI